MKQVFQNPKSGQTILKEIPIPALKKGGVLVKNYFSLISPGTERSLIELSKQSLFKKAKQRPDYVQKFIQLTKTKGLKAALEVAKSKLETEIALGYSSVGEVIKVGEGLEEFRVGDRVACGGQDYASHAEVVFVPKNLCVKVPDNVSLKEASFTTVGTIALQGIRRAKLTPGEKVAIIGLGLLGQIALRILKAYGFSVIGFDINPSQVEFAKKSDLDYGLVIGQDNIENVVNVFTDGKGIDAVLIYASAKNNQPLKLAVEISRDKGRIVQIGNILTEIPWRDFCKKELDYYSSRSYGPGRYDKNYEERGHDYPLPYVRWTEKRNMAEFLRLLAEKKISLENLISHSFDIAEAKKAYQLIFEAKEPVRGIILSFNKEKEHSDFLRLKPQTIEGEIYSPTKKVLKIGLIGLGYFALSTLLPHLKEVAKKIRNIELSTICDIRGNLAQKIGLEWRADYITTDYHRLLKDKNIDLIICTTRHSSHAQIVKEVLLANKNIYVEKPLCLNEKDLGEIIEIAQKSRGLLMVGFNRRFSFHFLKAKQEFSNSSSPLMILYRINYPLEDKEHWTYDLKEGGRILGECCHFVDALQYLTGSVPRRIYSQAISPDGAVKYQENIIINLEYQNKSLGTIFYSDLGNFKLAKEYIEIYGDDKIMLIDNFKKGRFFLANKTKKINLRHQDKGYFRELGEFIMAIQENKKSPISLEELYFSHLTIFKLMESLKENKVIEL